MVPGVRNSNVRWPTTVTAKEKDSRQKKKPRGKKKNLAAKRKTSRQKEKAHGKKKNLAAKRITPSSLFAASFFFLAASFFVLPRGFSFCRELFLFTARFSFMP